VFLPLFSWIAEGDVGLHFSLMLLTKASGVEETKLAACFISPLQSVGMLYRVMRFFTLQRFQAKSLAHPASCSVCTLGIFPKGKTGGV
jgi:hypothetical protein